MDADDTLELEQYPVIMNSDELILSNGGIENTMVASGSEYTSTDSIEDGEHAEPPPPPPPLPSSGPLPLPLASPKKGASQPTVEGEEQRLGLLPPPPPTERLSHTLSSSGRSPYCANPLGPAPPGEPPKKKIVSVPKIPKIPDSSNCSSSEWSNALGSDLELFEMEAKQDQLPWHPPPRSRSPSPLLSHSQSPSRSASIAQSLQSLALYEHTRHNAARCLQGFWRAVLCGRQVRERLDWVRDAAVFIQSWWRGITLRYRLCIAHQAAVLIQRVVRGYQGRLLSEFKGLDETLAKERQLLMVLAEDENAWARETMYDMAHPAPRTASLDQADSSIHTPLVVDISADLRTVYPLGWGTVLGSLLNRLQGTRSLPMLSIQCGAHFTVMLSSAGEVWTFGLGGRGQLGRPGHSMGKAKHRNDCGFSRPDRIAHFAYLPGCKSDPNAHTYRPKVYISKIAAGAEHCAALSEYGDLFTWGANGLGQLGYDLNPHQKPHLSRGSTHGKLLTYCGTPRQVKLTARCLDVRCGSAHTLALLGGGPLYTWGAGDPMVTHSSVSPWCPRRVQIAGMARKIACGAYFSACIRDDSSILTWGRNEHGQLGIGKKSKYETTPVRVQKSNGQSLHISEVVCGAIHCLVLSTSGRHVYSWGGNAAGQLGLGDHADRSGPAVVKALAFKGVKFLAAGARYSTAASMSEIWYWGHLPCPHILPKDTKVPSAAIDTPEPVALALQEFQNAGTEIRVRGLESTGASILSACNVRFTVVKKSHENGFSGKQKDSRDIDVSVNSSNGSEESQDYIRNFSPKTSASMGYLEKKAREQQWNSNFSRAHLSKKDEPLRSEAVASPMINPHKKLSLDPRLSRDMLSKSPLQVRDTSKFQQQSPEKQKEQVLTSFLQTPLNSTSVGAGLSYMAATTGKNVCQDNERRRISISAFSSITSPKYLASPQGLQERRQSMPFDMAQEPVASQTPLLDCRLQLEHKFELFQDNSVDSSSHRRSRSSLTTSSRRKRHSTKASHRKVSSALVPQFEAGISRWINSS